MCPIQLSLLPPLVRFAPVKSRADHTVTGFWWGNLEEGDHLEVPGVDGRIILRWNIRKGDGLIWLRIGTGGRHS